MTLFDSFRAISERVRSMLRTESTSEQPTTSATFERGDIVTDREADGDKELLVTGITSEQADTFVVSGTGQTVAEHNPEYPASDPVVEVRFFETLDAYLDDWTLAGVLETEASDDLDAGDPYFYPESRLERRA